MIKTFVDCPLRFVLRYELALPSTRMHLHSIVGTALHEIVHNIQTKVRIGSSNVPCSSNAALFLQAKKLKALKAKRKAHEDAIKAGLKGTLTKEEEAQLESEAAAISEDIAATGDDFEAPPRPFSQLP